MTVEVSGQERVTPRGARWARIVLLVGIAVAAVPFLSHFPRDQVLVFRPPHTAISRLEATWTQEGDANALGGVTLNFPTPTHEVVHRVSLPNGRYTLAIHYDRPQAEMRASNRGATPATNEPDDMTVTREVTLSGGETVIGL